MKQKKNDMKEFENPKTLHVFQFQDEDEFTDEDKSYLCMLYFILMNPFMFVTGRGSKLVIIGRALMAVDDSIKSKGLRREIHIPNNDTSYSYIISKDMDRILREAYNLYYSKIDYRHYLPQYHNILINDLVFLYNKITELQDTL